MRTPLKDHDGEIVMYFQSKNLSFTALKQKMSEMNLSFKEDVWVDGMVAISKNKENEVVINELLFRLFGDNVKKHVKFLSNLERADYYKVNRNGIVSIYRTLGSIEDLLLLAIEHTFHSVDTSKLEVQDLPDKCIISKEGKKLIIEPLRETDFIKVDEKRSKKIENAFKGLTNISSLDKINKKFKSFDLLRDNSEEFNLYTKNEGPVGKITGNSSPYMDNLNNYVAVFKEIMSLYMLDCHISLSQAQELFAVYFKSKNWNYLAQNEKKHSITPHQVIVRGGDGYLDVDDGEYLFESFSSALSFVLSHLEGNDSISISLGRETIYIGNHKEGGHFKVIIKSIYTAYSDYHEHFGTSKDNFSLCNKLPKLMEKIRAERLGPTAASCHSK